MKPCSTIIVAYMLGRLLCQHSVALKTVNSTDTNRNITRLIVSRGRWALYIAVCARRLFNFLRPTAVLQTRTEHRVYWIYPTYLVMKD